MSRWRNCSKWIIKKLPWQGLLSNSLTNNTNLFIGNSSSVAVNSAMSYLLVLLSWTPLASLLKRAKCNSNSLCGSIWSKTWIVKILKREDLGEVFRVISNIHNPEQEMAKEWCSVHSWLLCIHIQEYRARIISWRFCVNIFSNAMLLAQKVDR